MSHVATRILIHTHTFRIAITHFRLWEPLTSFLKSWGSAELSLRNIALEHAGKPGWFEIKWYTLTLACADNVNIMGRSVHTIKKKNRGFGSC